MPINLDDCENHFSSIRSAPDAGEVRCHLRALFDCYPVVSFEVGRGSVFWRGRKVTSAPYDCSSQMSYPPARFAVEGRLNDAGAPRLYAATREQTVLHELKAVEGDLVQFIGFRMKIGHTIRLAAIGELFHVYKTGYIRSLGKDPDNALSRMLNAEGLESATRLIYVDAFLASLLADPRAEESNYTATRLIASMALEDSGADGFFYPSVQDGLGTNLVIDADKYDSATHVVRSHIVRIKKVREFGLMDFEIVQEAAEMADNGVFSWKKPEAPNIARFFGLTEQEHRFLAARPQPTDANAFLDFVKLSACDD